MATALIGAGIAGLGSLLGGLFGNSGARKISAADENAAAIEASAGANAQANTQKQLAVGQSELAPYVAAGSPAFSTLGSLMQEGAQGQGPLASWTDKFQAPTDVTEANDPGYKFRLQQGQQALENSAAARGGLLSTGTGKQLQEYGQGYASNEYGNVYNRAMQQYQQQYQQFLNNQNNLYSRLMGIGQTGLQASEASAGLGANEAATYGQQGLAAAQGQAGYTAAAGGARAVGTGLLGSSISGAMGGLGGALSAGFPQSSSTTATPMPNQGSWTTASGGFGPNPTAPMSGSFAAGGRVRKGKKILVGEQGPEMFVPNANGRIIPNPMTVANMMGAG
jgi:hypothetical protein